MIPSPTESFSVWLFAICWHRFLIWSVVLPSLFQRGILYGIAISRSLATFFFTIMFIFFALHILIPKANLSNSFPSLSTYVPIFWYSIRWSYAHPLGPMPLHTLEMIWPISMGLLCLSCMLFRFAYFVGKYTFLLQPVSASPNTRLQPVCLWF